jgi:hypothetical protein
LETHQIRVGHPLTVIALEEVAGIAPVTATVGAAAIAPAGIAEAAGTVGAIAVVGIAVAVGIVGATVAAGRKVKSCVANIK